MLRSAWVVLAFVALGLWASLVPQVTYPSVSSGEPDGDVLIAWPGWSIQQELGPLSGTVGAFRIWVSADPTAFKDVTLNASLIDASSREVMRQTLVTVSRRYIPAMHTVTFPSYVAPSDQRLMLQLGVSESQTRHVIYRLAYPGPGRSSVMLNGVPDSGSGPLAFAHVRVGSGLRAAFDGDVSSRLRLALALVTGALAVLAHPQVASRLRPMAGGAGRRVGPLLVRVGRVVKLDTDRTTGNKHSRLHRLVEAPWYPWPAAAVPILHYLASNPLHFAVSESLIPLAVVLAAVTIIVVGLRLGLKDWHRSAAASTALIVVFYGYGHVAGAIDGRIDERVIFGLAVAVAASMAVLIVRRGAAAVRLAPFLNLMAAALLVFPVATLVAEAATAQRQPTLHSPEGVEDLTAHLLPSGLPEVVGKRPDIYYIILDAYSRQDALRNLFDFDNSDFLRELERRGFYVARAATSNYITTRHSLPSILNLAYLDGLGQRIPESRDSLVNVTRNHSLAVVIKSIGYEYIHLSSGLVPIDDSPLADQIITFTPSGTLTRKGADASSRTYPATGSFLLSTRFIRGLAQTTALSPVVGENFIRERSDPYEWWSAHLALRMFEFLSGAIDSEGPKFVLAHIIRPHGPFTFDQYGNFPDEGASLDDLHDPSVPSAYIGQLKYVNKRALEMIDGILQQSHPDSPIIIITGDHSEEDESSGLNTHAVLSAFHLPDGGNDGLYPSISLVNHFRYILDFYFDFNLGLLEDRLFWYPPDKVNFRK